MSRVARSLMVTLIALLFVGSVLVQGVPDHDAEVVYTWKATDDNDDADSNCQLISPSLEASDSPCELLAYEIGNTDTHVFFRWHVATFEFGQLAELLGTLQEDNPSLIYEQGFRTQADENNDFSFDIELRESGEPEIIRTSPEEWLDAGVVTVIIEDRASGIMTASIALEDLAPRLPGGAAQPGQIFNVTEARAPQTSVCFGVVEPLDCHGPGAVGSLFGWDGDEITSARSDANKTFTIEPYADFQPPAKTFYHDISGTPAQLEHVFDTPTIRQPWVSENHIYNWTLDVPAFSVSVETELERGSLSVTITDPTDTALFEADGATDEEFLGVEAGEWIIEVDLEGFEGTFRLVLEEVELPENDTGSGNGDETNGDDTNGNETNGDGIDDDEKGIPAPGAAVAVLVVLAALGGLRRLRHRQA